MIQCMSTLEYLSINGSALPKLKINARFAPNLTSINNISDLDFIDSTFCEVNSVKITI